MTEIPLIAFGTWVDLQSGERPEIMESLVTSALRVGYRHFDTASNYFTEPYVISALLSSGLPRTDYFLTSKLIPSSAPMTDQSTQRELDRVWEGVDKLRENLDGIEYYDLLLIHHPPQTSDRDRFRREILRQWQRMVIYLHSGVTRNIGVSNFYRNQLDLLLEICQENNFPFPVVNQLEIHPGNFSLELTEYCQSLGITVFAHTPLGGLASKEVLSNPVLFEIGERIGQFGARLKAGTPAQVVLAYDLARGVGVIPRTSNEQRMRENWESGNFTDRLTEEDFLALDNLDFGLGPMIESSRIDWEFDQALSSV